jgi:hypothetical protein
VVEIGGTFEEVSADWMMGAAFNETLEAVSIGSDEAIVSGAEIEREVACFTMFSNDNCLVDKEIGDETLSDKGALTGVPGFELERAALAAASISAKEGDTVAPTGDKSDVAEGVPAEELED